MTSGSKESSGPKGRLTFKERLPIADDTVRAIPAYFESKKQCRQFVKHYPEWDMIKGDPLIELMKLCRELRATDEFLIDKRRMYRLLDEEVDRDWEHLREKEKLLKMSFIKFDEFIKENRDKRERAARNINEQKGLQKLREAEIVELEKTLDSLQNICHRMKTCIEKYKPFQEYLEHVVQTSNFNSIASVFNRYDTLIDARNSIETNQTKYLNLIEDTNTYLQKLTEDKSLSLIDLNSQLANLQSRFVGSKLHMLHWERMVSLIMERTGRKELEDTQVRWCIWNLYQQICKRKNVPVEAKRSEIEKQMEVIKQTITELRKIVREVKRRTVRENKFEDIKIGFA